MKRKNTTAHAFAIGNMGQAHMAKGLEKAGCQVRWNPATDHDGMKKWDLSAALGRHQFTVEVKYDQKEAGSGNAAVEYYNTVLCEPSGIAATESDVWAFVFDNPRTAWVCRTADMRSYFENAPAVRDTLAGDGNAMVRLFKSQTMREELLINFDELAPPQARSLLTRLLGTGPVLRVAA